MRTVSQHLTYARERRYGRLMGSTLMVAIFPWLVLAISARTDGLGMGWGGALAAATALAVNAWTFRRHRTFRPFEVASVVLFSTMALVAVIAPGSATATLDRYARAIATGALALFAFGSLLWRPLTSDFTSDRVPAGLAGSDAHRRLNAAMTLLVGLAATVAALSYVAGASVGHKVGITVFNWYIPLVMVAACAAACATLWRATLEAAEEATELHRHGAASLTLLIPDRPARRRPPLRLLASRPPSDEPCEERTRQVR